MIMRMYEVGTYRQPEARNCLPQTKLFGCRLALTNDTTIAAISKSDAATCSSSDQVCSKCVFAR